jgi:hypothetical protein
MRIKLILWLSLFESEIANITFLSYISYILRTNGHMDLNYQ